jgi:tRNA-binding protein
MLFINYNKTSLKDTLIININDNHVVDVKRINDLVYGVDVNNKPVFINVFNLSKHLKLPEGYLQLNEKINTFIQERLMVDLHHHFHTLPFVVGNVLKCELIKDTHLHLCEVDVGKQTLPIVCGASNIREGLKVVVARVGAVMPNGLSIKASKLMNHDSYGMICSAKELNLKKHKYNTDGIIELPSSFVVGEDFIEPFDN